MGEIEIQFSEIERTYTGAELRPHALLRNFNFKGSGIVAYLGPCRVETGELVDWEDRLAGDRIEARSMVHFQGEFFGMSLREGVFLQRLIIALMAESLDGLQRTGNDLYLGTRKLSVSIVTASPVSVLLHIGVNIDPVGAPVPAVGLLELGLNTREWANQILDCIKREWRGIEWAVAKVRPVV